MKTFLAALILCAVWPAVSNAQGRCGPGGCSIPWTGPGQTIEPPRLVIEWKHADARNDYLYVGGQLVLCFDKKYGTLTQWDGKSWGDAIVTEGAGQANVTEEVEEVEVVGAQPTGVDYSKFPKAAERCTISGKEASCKDAKEAIEKASPADLKDDSTALRLTVIDADAGRRKATRQAIEADQVVKEHKAHVHIWDAAPEDWSVKERFKTDVPGIVAQAGDGTVIFRTEGTDVKPVIEALRRRLPNYDPAKDPAPGGSILARIEAWLSAKASPYLTLGAGAGLLALLFLTPGKETS